MSAGSSGRRRLSAPSTSPIRTRSTCSAISSTPSACTSSKEPPMASTVDTKQIIYSLIDVGRIHPPKKQVLKGIYLSFYYGAKIGVLGDNGSGKSTLLRI